MFNLPAMFALPAATIHTATTTNASAVAFALPTTFPHLFSYLHTVPADLGFLVYCILHRHFVHTHTCGFLFCLFSHFLCSLHLHYCISFYHFTSHHTCISDLYTYWDSHSHFCISGLRWVVHFHAPHLLPAPAMFAFLTYRDTVPHYLGSPAYSCTCLVGLVRSTYTAYTCLPATIPTFDILPGLDGQCGVSCPGLADSFPSFFHLVPSLPFPTTSPSPPLRTTHSLCYLPLAFLTCSSLDHCTHSFLLLYSPPPFP